MIASPNIHVHHAVLSGGTYHIALSSLHGNFWTVPEALVNLRLSTGDQLVDLDVQVRDPSAISLQAVKGFIAQNYPGSVALSQEDLKVLALCCDLEVDVNRLQLGLDVLRDISSSKVVEDMDVLPRGNLVVACLPGHLAMQRVLLQMGLRVLSSDLCLMQNQNLISVKEGVNALKEYDRSLSVMDGLCPSCLNIVAECKCSSSGNVVVSYLAAATTSVPSFFAGHPIPSSRQVEPDFIQKVVNWTAHDFRNEDLFRKELCPIPKFFSDSNEYFQGFCPFVVEEIRSQISKEINLMNFKTAERFKFEITNFFSPKLIVYAEGNWATVVQTQPCLCLIVETAAAKASPPLSGATLANFRHMLVAINVDYKWLSDLQKRKIAATTNVHFDVRFPTSDCADKLIQSKSFSEWDLYILDVGTTAPGRIINALLSKKTPTFMDEILSGQFQYDPMKNGIALADGAGAGAKDIGCFVNHLNQSQKEAVEKILDVGLSHVAPIQLIKGPPGTGKTSTITAVIRSLTALGHRVHATAPTNVAVCEIATRTLDSLLSDGPDTAHKLPLSNVLLVGTKTRLKLHDGDSLDKIFFESRVHRLSIAAFMTLPAAFESFSTFVRVQAIDTHVMRREELVDISIVFTDIVKAFENICAIFVNEAPRHFRQVLGRENVASVQRAFAVVLALSSDTLREWLMSTLEEKEASVDMKTACSTILSFADKLYRRSQELFPNKKQRKSEIENAIISEATLIFSSVNSGGRTLFTSISFDVCIIDEATQLVEAEVPIVLRRDLRCLVLVGDEKQLPSTVISSAAQKGGYGESMFDRLLKANYPHSLLDTQYRMHPLISHFPREQFYDGKVVDGHNVLSPAYNKAWHLLFPPVSVYDVNFGTEETSESGSKYNETEAAVVRQIAGMIKQKLSDAGAVSVGILTPYAEQVKRLSHLVDSSTDLIKFRVCTIDGFQGQETDIIIFSAVRSNNFNKIGFLSDMRRSNVAITRARYSLIIVCNRRTVSCNSTWNALMSHAEETDSVRTFQDCDILKRRRKALLNIETRLESIRQASDDVFEAAPWRVIFAKEFKDNISKRMTRTQVAIIGKLLALAYGEWPKYELKSLDVGEDFQNVIHVHRVEGLRLIWSVDVSHSTCAQYLKVWNVIGSDINPNQAIRRVISVLSTYSAEYIARCSCKLKSTKHPNKYVPRIWEMDSDFSWLKAKDRQAQGAAVLERSSIDCAAVLTKFYPLDSGTARLLMQDSPELNVMDLPFEMSPEEEKIVRYSGSMLVLGRSGTGKTTALLHRMFAESLSHEDMTPPQTCNQLMVTASPILCKAISRSYDKMRSTHIAASMSSTKALEDHPKRANVPRTVPLSFAECSDAHFPLIVTFSDFLKMLDSTLSQPFFAQCDEIEENVDEDDDFGIYRVIGGAQRHQIAVTRKASARLEVDYDRFVNHYFPRFDDHLENDADQVYLEIMSNIKGSLHALHSEKGHLSLDQYISLSDSRSSTLSKQHRQEIYRTFEKYEKLKTQSFREFDVLDVVFFVYSSLRIMPYSGARMTSVYIDEVQDLTPAQLALFQFVCPNPRGFVFAGDTAQTIAHGVGFNFATVKDIFYDEFLKDVDREDKALLQKLTPSVTHLNKNFRTHSGVISIANSVVELIYNFFPHSIDKLDPEESNVFGPAPLFIDSADDVVVELFQNNDSTACDFGAEQVVLVRDEVTKARVSAISGNRALVLTVLEAKGMEFTDCLVYNFFESSPLKNIWRVIYNMMKDSREARPAFDVTKHSGLCVELKLLYVLLTRARQHLVIFDQDVSSRKPMLDFWSQRNLVQCMPLDDDIRSMFVTVSTPEEWKEKGKEFQARNQYRNACMCYHRAGDEFKERECHALELEQDAGKVVVKHPKDAQLLYSQAGEIFEQLGGHPLKAGRCYEAAQDFGSAARIYFDERVFDKAAICFGNIQRWAEAAEAHQNNNNVHGCLKACYNGLYFDRVVDYLANFKAREIISSEDAAALELACVKKAAIHYHCRNEKVKMLHFVALLPTVEEKRVFLKRYGHSDLLLPIELENKCFKEAAQICESLYDFERAATYYAEVKMVTDSSRCLLTQIRQDHYDNDLFHKPISVIKYFNQMDTIAEQCQQPCVPAHGRDLMLKELKFLRSSANAEKKSKPYKQKRKQKTKQKVACDDKQENQCEMKKTLVELVSQTACEVVSGVVEWQSWKLHLRALRELLRLCDSSQTRRSAIQELNTAVQYVFSTIENLIQHGSLNKLSSVDRQRVLQVLDFFEFRLENSGYMCKTVVGPNSLKALSTIFCVVSNSPASVVGGVELKINLKDFATKSKLFFVRLMMDQLDLQKKGLQEELSACEVKSFSQNFCECLQKGHDGGRSTETRVSLLVELFENMNDHMRVHSTEFSGGNNDKAKQRDKELRTIVTTLAKVLLPVIPRIESAGALFAARCDPRVVKMVGMYMRLSFSQPHLHYEQIALALLFSEVAGNESSEAGRIYHIIKTEAKKSCVNMSFDPRTTLSLSLLYESSTSPDVSLGNIFHSIQLLFRAVTDDCKNGGLYKCLWQKPSVVHPKHLCFSPCSFIRMLEKSFVLSLCYMKRFREVILPFSLASDVLLKKKKGYGECLDSYIFFTGPQKNDSSHPHPVNIRVGLARDMLFRERFSMMTLIFNLLQILSVESFSSWFKVNEPQADRKSIEDCFSSFTMRLAFLLVTLAINLNVNKSCEKTHIVHILRQIENLRRKDSKCLLPHVFEAYLLKELSVNNILSKFSEFCHKFDNDEVLCLTCDPTDLQLPHYLAKLKVTRKILTVSRVDKCLRFVSPDDMKTLSASAPAFVPTVELLDGGGQGSDDSLLDDIDDDGGPAAVNLDLLVHAPPSRQRSTEEQLRKWTDILLMRLEKARARIASFTPLEISVRRVEKEFIIAGGSWRRHHASLATASLCPLYEKLVDMHETLGIYKSDESHAAEKRDEAMDKLSRIDALMNAMLPDGVFLNSLSRSSQMVEIAGASDRGTDCSTDLLLRHLKDWVSLKEVEVGKFLNECSDGMARW